MRRAAMLICSLLFALALPACTQAPQTPRPAFYTDLAQQGATLDPVTSAQILNSYRESKGFNALTLDLKLEALAKAEAMRLAAKGEITPGQDAALNAALKASGYSPSQVKRSVTGGYHSFADAFSGWRGAAHHNAVLLIPKAKSFGLAAYAASGSRHRVYWVLLVSQ